MMYATVSQHHVQPPRSKLLPSDWNELRVQLIMRFNRLTLRELDEAGPNPSRLAHLIQQRHGVAPELAENYLRTIARNLGLVPRNAVYRA